MPIDPSIALQAGQGVTALTNPMDSFSKVAGLANTLSQNRLIDASAQNAVDQNRNIKLQGDTSAQALGVATHQAVAQIANTALSQYDPKDPQGTGPNVFHALISGIDAGVQAGSVTPAMADYFKKNIIGSGSPDHLVSMVANVRQQALQALTPADAMNRVNGTNGTMNNGQSLQPGIIADPMRGGGFTPSGPATDVYPSRAELGERVQIGTDAKGAPIYGPKVLVTPPALTGGAGASVFPNGGRLPSALRGPNATPNVPNNGVTTNGQGPATTAAQSTTGTASAAAFQGYADEGTKARSQDAVLANMQTDAAQFATGPGQDKIKQFQAVLQRVSPTIAGAFGVKPESIAANESFDKLAAQIAGAQGAGSDARLSVAQAGNPSSHLTPAGVDMILRQLRGNTDYLRARQTLAAAYTDKTDREGFEAKVAANLDPRAFQYAKLTPEQRGTYLANIKDGNDMKAFQKSYLWAEKNGLIGNANAGQ